MSKASLKMKPLKRRTKIANLIARLEYEDELLVKCLKRQQETKVHLKKIEK